MTSLGNHSKISTTLYFKRELHRKMMTRKNGYGILNDIMELELDYMGLDDTRIKSDRKGHGTSRNLNVVVKIVKRNFKTFGPVYFYIHSLMLIRDQKNSTEH